MNKAIRIRIYPKLYDFSYLVTKSNLMVFKNLLELIKKSYSIEQTIYVLDLGCGYKPFEKLFYNEGIKNVIYIGVDFDKNSSNADIILDLNYQKVPIEDERFDIIILSEVLEHLYNPLNAIREATRLVKVNGYVYISTPFIFPYHGTPYDYYRYTEFFYKKITEDFGYEILRIQKAGTFISVPIYTFNIFVETITNKLNVSFIGYISHVIMNIFGNIS